MDLYQEHYFVVGWKCQGERVHVAVRNEQKSLNKEE